MKSWAFTLCLLLAASRASAQGDCPTARSARLIPAITPVVGQSPMWITTGAGPLAWKGPSEPVVVLWVRDQSVRGPALLSGQQRGGGAKVRFSRPGALSAFRDEQMKLDSIGLKPSKVTPEELQKYSFHQTEVWFPAAGCYELSARVGREQSVIVMRVAAPATKK